MEREGCREVCSWNWLKLTSHMWPMYSAFNTLMSVCACVCMCTVHVYHCLCVCTRGGDSLPTCSCSQHSCRSRSSDGQSDPRSGYTSDSVWHGSASLDDTSGT